MNSQRLLSILVSRTLTQRTPAPSIQSWSRLRATSVVQEKRFCSSVPKPQKQLVNVTFLLRDGKKQQVKAKVGDNLLDIIIENNVDIDGFGACEGTLACSTCHLIFKPEDFNKLPDKPTDEELDMLDLAFGLTETSRLGCQVIVTKDMDGLEITVPKGVSDARK
ncbi:adrenodoxin-like protein 2, mitochondrial isoform X1 [Biomphalaria glabrata]|uniref:Adrenodoxin-like protein 2, mitochondrial isoform X1 n=1 Tax=Biomphalaria glabrata TaxID=6526 RepID=A0A2C9K4H5_BIOGL|nr:adrenodoxin-like protein 2, mitochondrial isoform X1 [Biomphalaria glabrata]